MITGFTAGIAVIIASSQVNDFLGLGIARLPADFLPRWSAYLQVLDRVDPITVAVAGGPLVLIVMLRRWAPRLPAFLVAIVAGAVLVWLLGLSVDTIGSRFPSMEGGLPMPALPAFSLAKIEALAPAAFTIAFLAGIESLLSAVVADGMTGFRHRSNQELVGQGVGNLASALFGGMPATGAIARTAANIKAGGRSPVGRHCSFRIPARLRDLRDRPDGDGPDGSTRCRPVPRGVGHERSAALPRAVAHAPLGERTVLLLTFGLTILVDLTVAIGVGITLSSLLLMARMSEGAAVTSSEDVDEAEDASQRDQLPVGVEVFAINGPFFFGIAQTLLEAFKRVGASPSTIILRLERVPSSMRAARSRSTNCWSRPSARASGSYCAVSGGTCSGR